MKKVLIRFLIGFMAFTVVSVARAGQHKEPVKEERVPRYETMTIPAYFEYDKDMTSILDQMKLYTAEIKKIRGEHKSDGTLAEHDKEDADIKELLEKVKVKGAVYRDKYRDVVLKFGWNDIKNADSNILSDISEEDLNPIQRDLVQRRYIELGKAALKAEREAQHADLMANMNAEQKAIYHKEMIRAREQEKLEKTWSGSKQICNKQAERMKWNYLQMRGEQGQDTPEALEYIQDYRLKKAECDEMK